MARANPGRPSGFPSGPVPERDPAARLRVVVVSHHAEDARELVASLADAGTAARAATRGAVMAWGDGEVRAVEVVVLETAELGDEELGLVERVRERSPMTEIVVLSSDPRTEGAVQAVRSGVHSVLRAPVSPERLACEIEAARKRRRHGETRMSELSKEPKAEP